MRLVLIDDDDHERYRLNLQATAETNTLTLFYNKSDILVLTHEIYVTISSESVYCRECIAKRM